MRTEVPTQILVPSLGRARTQDRPCLHIRDRLGQRQRPSVGLLPDDVIQLSLHVTLVLTGELFSRRLQSFTIREGEVRLIELAIVDLILQSSLSVLSLAIS